MGKKKMVSLSGIVGLALLVLVMQVVAVWGAPQSRAGWPKEVIIGAPSLGSSYYICNAGLSNLLKKHLGVPGTVEVTGGVDPATRMMMRGEINLNAGSNVTVMHAYHGTGRFKDAGKQPLRMIGNAYALIMTTWVRADSGIKTFQDLKGRKWMADKPGASVVKVYRDAILKHHGLTINNFTMLPIKGVRAACDNLRDRLTDAWTWPTSFGPAAEIVELSQVIPLNVIPLNEGEMNALFKASKSFYRSYVKSGLFKGIDKNMPAVGIGIVFYVMEDMPADFVYSLLDLMYGKTNKEFTSLHPTAQSMTIDHALDTMPIPLHEGAVRYYKDRGIWTGELAKRQKELIKGQ
jgi:TRAP transporter TAXI family solute receptor